MSCSIPSWDKVSSSLAESRFGSLDLHVMGGLSSLDCRCISRGDGTIFMAYNGRRALADTSSRSPDIDHRSRSCSIPSWDKVSSSLAESRFGSLDLHVMGNLSSLDCRSISRGDGTIFMADNGRRTLADTSSRSPGIDHRNRSYSIPSWDEVSSSLAESRFGSLDH